MLESRNWSGGFTVVPKPGNPRSVGNPGNPSEVNPLGNPGNPLSVGIK